MSRSVTIANPSMSLRPLSSQITGKGTQVYYHLCYVLSLCSKLLYESFSSVERYLYTYI